MMVTAKNSELDIVTALDSGADEYITKPYGMLEFVSRVRALLRRAREWGGDASDGELSRRAAHRAAPSAGRRRVRGPSSP